MTPDEQGWGQVSEEFAAWGAQLKITEPAMKGGLELGV